MAGGGTSEEEILLQVQGLVSDSLAVVSYKWLSRNFSLSSNAAKRLLQNFAKQNEDSDLQVVYAISGWSKIEPQSYIIQLVPKSKLDEVKAALKDTPSIHVYSVQQSLPKDPAQLYSPDFVQAEQLFNESAENNNCLRDNRFSAVTCELVHRFPTRRKSHVASPRPPISGGSDKSPRPVTKPVPKAPLPSTPATSVPRKNSDAIEKDDRPGEKKPTKSSISPKTPLTESKDSLGPGSNAAGKRKSPATATVAVSGGTNANSLASMWGRAPAKKAASPSVAAASEPAANPPRSAALAGDAEARIQAMEEEDGSEDDMVKEFTSMRRGQMPNGAGRRRRMIVDDGDEDEDEEAEGDNAETIIGLDSPEPPKKGKPGASATATPAARDTRVKREGAVQTSVQGKSPSPDRESPEVGVKLVKRESSSLPDIESKSKTNNTENSPESHAQPAVESVPDAARVSSKRKKVLKTRVDERGREVTEVVWEGEEKENVEKDKAPAAKASAPLKQNDTKPPVAKPQAAHKPSVAPSKPAAGKASSKVSAKSAKPAKGQGNIMSFFKKK